VAYASSYNFFTSNSLVVKPEMAGRLVEWRVDDRIFDDDLTHALSCRAERADAQAMRPDLFTGKLFCDRDPCGLQRKDSEFRTNLSGFSKRFVSGECERPINRHQTVSLYPSGLASTVAIAFPQANKR
jgi:hypothetical protein